jgi:ubiquitin conjugation factor E4 B
LTALHASSEEVAEWLKSKNPATAGDMNQYNDGEKRLQESQEASSSGSNNASPKYSFICECFFMTARVLNLGLLKAFSDYKHLAQVMTCMFGQN